MGGTARNFGLFFLISISVSIVAVDEKRLGWSVRAAERVSAVVLPQVPRQVSVPVGRRLRVAGVLGRGPRRGGGAGPVRDRSRSPEGLPGTRRGLLPSCAPEETAARRGAAVRRGGRCGGRYPAEGAALKSGSLLPPLSIPPAPGPRVSLPERGARARGSPGAVRSLPRLQRGSPL